MTEAAVVKTEFRVHGAGARSVCWITIDRAERRNALNPAVGAGIVAGLDLAEADPACRAIVLTGAGDKAFCAGGDLVAKSGDSPFHFDATNPTNFVVTMLRRMDACKLPIVARVNGHALAGGLGLLCACDLAVTSDAATFGTPEVGIGVFPMMILPYMLRVLPMRKLLELCITGERVSVQEALALGLVNHVAPAAELDAKVDWLLGRIVDKAPAAIRLGKMGLNAMRDMTTDQALEYAQLMIAAMGSTADAAEGLNAFREKRAPEWTGK